MIATIRNLAKKIPLKLPFFRLKNTIFTFSQPLWGLGSSKYTHSITLQNKKYNFCPFPFNRFTGKN
jgi:hypothetical protein